MPTVTSKDGTRIGYDFEGQGPPLILVDGAMCYRASGPARPLAKLLNSNFTVLTYDRRGRGESSDSAPYAIEREIEDIEALLRAAGGSAFVYGCSSGAALALEAAARIPGIQKLALYEAPFIVDSTHSPLPDNFLAQLKDFVATGRRGDAVKLFMRRVGVPAFGIFVMRLLPIWKKLTAIAHTLPYDITIIQDYSRGKPLPQTKWSAATMPTLAADGGKSPAYLRNSMRAIADVLPNATYHSVPGQTHMLKAEAIAPVLIEFFSKG